MNPLVYNQRVLAKSASTPCGICLGRCSICGFAWRPMLLVLNNNNLICKSMNNFSSLYQVILVSFKIYFELLSGQLTHFYFIIVLTCIPVKACCLLKWFVLVIGGWVWPKYPWSEDPVTAPVWGPWIKGN